MGRRKEGPPEDMYGEFARPVDNRRGIASDMFGEFAIPQRGIKIERGVGISGRRRTQRNSAGAVSQNPQRGK